MSPGLVSDTHLFEDCPSRSDYPPDENILTCENCGELTLYCCQHDGPCHHFPIIMTDGACLGNGTQSARAGMGAYWSTKPNTNYSSPVTDAHDPDQPRTNQRAELLAVIYGLAEFAGERTHKREHGSQKKTWIIATDSKYVVDGITDWLARWRRNRMRTSNGRSPMNLDLFLRLDSIVEEYERRYSCHIGFWHVERRYNHEADSLARAGAMAASPVLQEPVVEYTGFA